MAIERIVPGTPEWEAYYANHIVRYNFATSLLSGIAAGKVLDAACGVGYGSHSMAQNMRQTEFVAIDRSQEALDVAESNFKCTNLSFLQDDCHTLSAASAIGMFDCIVSFETLEHLPRPAEFLNSCFKILSKDGCLIVSTPNQSVTSPGNNLQWEFHEKEYTAAELKLLLAGSGFTDIKLYGQSLNLKGKIKEEMRSQLNVIWSNPFLRLGRLFQSVVKNRRFSPVLKEEVDDFEITAFENEQQIDSMGLNGPFVIIAVASK